MEYINTKNLNKKGNYNSQYSDLGLEFEELSKFFSCYPNYFMGTPDMDLCPNPKRPSDSLAIDLGELAREKQDIDYQESVESTRKGLMAVEANRPSFERE